jgi:hypothetical protein
MPSLPTPQVLQLPRESVDLGHAVEQPIPGGTHGASADPVLAWEGGLDVANVTAAVAYGLLVTDATIRAVLRGEFGKR